MFDGCEHAVIDARFQRCAFGDDGIGFGVKRGGAFAVFHGLGIDVDVQRCAFNGSLSKEDTDANVADGELAALFNEDFKLFCSSENGFHDAHWHNAGLVEGVFHDGVAFRIVLGNAVGFGERLKSDSIAVDEIDELVAQTFQTVAHGFHFFFVVGVFFLADGEIGHHHAEGCGKCPNGSGRAAAAGNRRIGGQLRKKLSCRFF